MKTVITRLEAGPIAVDTPKASCFLTYWGGPEEGPARRLSPLSHSVGEAEPSESGQRLLWGSEVRSAIVVGVRGQASNCVGGSEVRSAIFCVGKG